MGEASEASRILREWKGNSYIFGRGVLDSVGALVETFGKSTMLVGSRSDWAHTHLKTVTESLERSGVSYTIILGARPNCPREDLYRLALQVAMRKPDSLTALGGGSTIDCCKAASVLATYSPVEVSVVLDMSWDEACSIEPYFGTGVVTKMKKATGRNVLPVVAVQTASSSAAHLTKYSNITDPLAGQKKLIVDEAIVPRGAVFDYGITMGAPEGLTLDGGLDGIAHSWEVYMGATGKKYLQKVERVALKSIRLIVKNLKLAKEDPYNVEARTALGLGTDLGGYAIMIGGTNGPHLGSFSLVDIMTHGRACAILGPYYTVFFSQSIQRQLSTIGPIFQEGGFIEEDLKGLKGRRLGEAVAKGMINFNKSLGFPTTLKEAGATEEHLKRMLNAAKAPELKMKLLNMPTPLEPDKGDIDRYMKSVLEAAFTGELETIKTIETQ
jgi:alcohol dehydrogenase